MLRRIVLPLLVLALLLTALVGCNGNGGKEGGSTETEDPATTTPINPEGDTIGTYDFNDEEFTILTRSETKYEFAADKGLGGDTVERAVYKRNYEVQERFNVYLKILTQTGGWDQRSEFLAKVRAEAMGGGGGYDLVSTHSVYLGWMTVEGLATDMATLPEMDFSKVWWNQNLYDEININGHVYFMLGDICTTTYEYMQVVFMNETEFNNYFAEDGVDTVYNLVENGEWTWEKCMDYALEYGTDGNSDVLKYGMAQNIHSWRASFIGQDAYVYTRDAKRDLMITESPSEKLVGIVEDMIDFYAQENIFFHTAWDTGASVLNKEFCGGNVLFYPQTLGEASVIAQSMKDQYGVIPLPKYDTYQEKYYTICRDTVSAVMIMSTTDAPEMSGVITEALCMYGHTVVTPEYYEIVLKVRYFDDPKYSAVLDTIRDGLTIQPVACYIENSEHADMFLDVVLKADKSKITSTYTACATRAQIALNNFYTSMKAQGLY